MIDPDPDAISCFMEDENLQDAGWMDDRWNEDYYEFGLTHPEGGGGPGRGAGERMTTPLNHEEI